MATKKNAHAIAVLPPPHPHTQLSHVKVGGEKESRAGEIDADKGYVAKCESSYNPLTASKEKTLENRSPTILVLPMLVDTSINYLIFLRAFPMIMGLN